MQPRHHPSLVCIPVRVVTRPTRTKRISGVTCASSVADCLRRSASIATMWHATSTASTCTWGRNIRINQLAWHRLAVSSSRVANWSEYHDAVFFSCDLNNVLCCVWKWIRENVRMYVCVWATGKLREFRYSLLLLLLLVNKFNLPIQKSKNKLWIKTAFCNKIELCHYWIF